MNDTNDRDEHSLIMDNTREELVTALDNVICLAKERAESLLLPGVIGADDIIAKKSLALVESLANSLRPAAEFPDQS